jgi:hypothetical protein
MMQGSPLFRAWTRVLARRSFEARLRLLSWLGGLSAGLLCALAAFGGPDGLLEGLIVAIVALLLQYFLSSTIVRHRAEELAALPDAGEDDLLRGCIS